MSPKVAVPLKPSPEECLSRLAGQFSIQRPLNCNQFGEAFAKAERIWNWITARLAPPRAIPMLVSVVASHVGTHFNLQAPARAHIDIALRGLPGNRGLPWCVVNAEFFMGKKNRRVAVF